MRIDAKHTINFKRPNRDLTVLDTTVGCLQHVARVFLKFSDEIWALRDLLNP